MLLISETQPSPMLSTEYTTDSSYVGISPPIHLEDEHGDTIPSARFNMCYDKHHCVVSC